MIALLFQREPLEQLGSLPLKGPRIPAFIQIGSQLFRRVRHDPATDFVIYVEDEVLYAERLGPVIKVLQPPVRIAQPDAAARSNEERPPRLSEAAPSTSWDD